MGEEGEKGSGGVWEAWRRKLNGWVRLRAVVGLWRKVVRRRLTLRRSLLEEGLGRLKWWRVKRAWEGLRVGVEVGRKQKGGVEGIVRRGMMKQGMRRWMDGVGRFRKVDRMMEIFEKFRARLEGEDEGGMGEAKGVFRVWKERVKIMREREVEWWNMAVEWERVAVMRKAWFGLELGKI